MYNCYSNNKWQATHCLACSDKTEGPLKLYSEAGNEGEKMAHSMTAFARKTQQYEWGELTWELKTVNHRYLDVSLKLADNFRELEGSTRDYTRKNLKRGKFDAYLKYSSNGQQAKKLILDSLALSELASTLKNIQTTLPEAKTPNALELLAWPGILQEESAELSMMQDCAQELFKQTLEELKQSRAREGEQLAQFVGDHLQSIEKIVKNLQNQLPDLLAKQRQYLLDRFSELNLELDAERIEQEFALIVNKTDVQEEIERLLTHIKETKRVIKQKGSIGRQLDFIMQEFNREANTLSSKAVDIIVTQSAIELKVLIEQMREQVQNIE